MPASASPSVSSTPTAASTRRWPRTWRSRQGRWYHLAASSDGRTLRLYVDALDGRGYVQRAAKELPATGSTALGKGEDDAEWTIGRAGNAGNPTDWLRFRGWIDEVRICDTALAPAEFLFAPNGKDYQMKDEKLLKPETEHREPRRLHRRRLSRAWNLR